jgi:LysM repeat protein
MARNRRLIQVALGLALTLACASAWAASRSYVVKANEGWFQIAKSQKTTMKDLLAANHATTATKLRVGQKIQLPPAPAHPKTAKAAPKAAPKK